MIIWFCQIPQFWCNPRWLTGLKAQLNCQILHVGSTQLPNLQPHQTVVKVQSSIFWWFFDSHKKCEFVMISVGWPCQLGVRYGEKTFDVLLFWNNNECNKCQTLHDGDHDFAWFTSYWVLPHHSTSSDLDHIWRSQQCQTLYAENLIFLHDWVETLYDCQLLTRSWIYHYYWLSHVFKGDTKHTRD